MVAEVLLVAQGRVSKESGSETKLQSEPGRRGDVQAVNATKSVGRGVEVRVVGLADLGEGVESALPGDLAGSSSWVFATIASVGLG